MLAKWTSRLFQHYKPNFGEFYTLSGYETHLFHIFSAFIYLFFRPELQTSKAEQRAKKHVDSLTSKWDIGKDVYGRFLIGDCVSAVAYYNDTQWKSL